MMNLKALLTVIVLGTSTIAAADITTADAYQTSSWIALTEPMPLSRGRDVIKLSSKQFTQLRFQTTMGSSHIERVIVQFTDGTSQSIDLNVKLDVSNPMVQFAVDGSKRIDRVVVVGASSRRSAVQMFGM